MSPSIKAFLMSSIILGQFMRIVFCKTVELTCPTTPAWPITMHNSLESSCFDLDITINVENILPDPTYILPQDNLGAIMDGLKRTFDDYEVEIELDETEIDNINIWTVDNQCTRLTCQTCTSRHFITTQYHTLCDKDTLIIDDLTGTIKCELTFPNSIVYVWYLQQINLRIDIDSCSAIIMHAKVSNTTDSMYVLAVSEPIKISEDDPSHQKYEFIFNASTNTLLPNVTYFITFEIVNASGWHNKKYRKVEFENVKCDEIITISQPNSCSLGKNVAVTKEMAFGLQSLCNTSMERPEQQLFELALFQNHSSHNNLRESIWNSLSQRRRMLPDCCGGNPDPANCLKITFSDGSQQKIADDSVFPYMSQCVAIDGDTRRVFSVGGNDENGNAVDRLAVYYLASQSSAILLDYPNLKLDKPRAMTSCYYYKRDEDEEYIVAINGMSHTKFANNSDYWYKDIAFIPLSGEKDCDIPKVELKFNVIDMKSFVTENHILYLVGGRNEENATNVIQVIDLHQVFNASVESKDKKKQSYDRKKDEKKKSYDRKKDKDISTTYERMAPMSLHRVFPFVDFSYVAHFNSTCMVMWSGQKYINQQWVGIDSSVTELQVYCNELLVGYLNTTSTAFGGFVDIRFTDYDEKNLVSMEDTPSDSVVSDDRVSMRHYNFTNDGLWYKFSVKFKICFDEKTNRNGVSFFNDFTVDNKKILEQNILIESQKNYRDWSYGFGKVDILNIDICGDIGCSKDSESKETSNKQKTEVSKTKMRSKSHADVFDMIYDEDNKETNDYYNHSMRNNFIAFGLCIFFLVWLSITCCCKKYNKLYYV